MQKNYKCIYDPLSELMAYYSKEKTKKVISLEKRIIYRGDFKNQDYRW